MSSIYPSYTIKEQDELFCALKFAYDYYDEIFEFWKYPKKRTDFNNVNSVKYVYILGKERLEVGCHITYSMNRMIYIGATILNVFEKEEGYEFFIKIDGESQEIDTLYLPKERIRKVAVWV